MIPVKPSRQVLPALRERDMILANVVLSDHPPLVECGATTFEKPDEEFTVEAWTCDSELVLQVEHLPGLISNSAVDLEQGRWLEVGIYLDRLWR